MTLRNKTLLGILLAFIGSIAILYVIAQFVLLRGFVQAEENDTRRDVERALDILAYDRSTLEGITRDWAGWDDTYAFIQDANDTYVQSNLSDNSVFVNNRLNVVAYINPSRQIVFATSYNSIEQKQQPLPESLKQLLADERTDKLLQHSNTESALTGWMLTPEGPLLISSQPIVTTKRQGPIRGTLIFGRYLDAAAIKRLGETSHLSLAFHPFDEPQMPADFQTARASVEKTAIPIQPLSEETIAGYTVLEDIYAKPALLLRFSNPRVIYSQGQTTLRYFVGWLLLVELVFGLGGVVLIGRLERSYADISALREAQEALRRRDAILEAVRFAAEQFLKTTDWEQNIQEVLARLGNAERTSRVFIFQNHARPDGTLLTSQRYEWVAAGIPPQITNSELQDFPFVAAGFARWVPLLNTGQLIRGHVRDFPESERTVLAAQDIQSIVVAPIFVGQALWGFIGFDECLAERKWSAAEMSALEAAANTLGTAIERKRVDQELCARVAELEAVRQASLSLTSSLDLSAVLDAILQNTLRFASGAKNAHIYLYQTGRLSFGTSLWADGRKGEQYAEPRSDGLTYTVAQRAETIIVPDMRLHPLFATAPHEWTGAMVGLALKSGNRVLGVMNVAYHEPHTFPETELRALHLLADQAAIAIANAQLHQDLRASETRYRTLVENIPIGIYRVTPGPAGRFRMANPAYLKMFGYDSFAELSQVNVSDVYFDPAERKVFSDRLIEQGSVSGFEQHLKKKDGTPIWASVTAQVVRKNGEPDYFDCTVEDITARKQTEEGLHDKITALQTLARIQQDITSTLSLSDRLDRLLEHLLSQMRADMGVVSLIDPATNELRAIARRGARRGEFWHTFLLKIGEGAAGWIAQNGVPLAISDVRQDARWVRTDVSDDEGIISYLGVPLRVEGQVIGVLDMATRTPREFTAEEVEFLATLAGQASIAIQNARLFEETKRRADQLAILNRIASAINRTLDLDPLLEEIHREVTATLTPDAFFIALYAATTDELDFRIRMDEGMRASPERQPLQTATFASRVVISKKPLLIRDWEKEKHLYPPPKLFGTMKPSRTWLGVPMLLGEQVVGVISAQSYRPNAYGKDEEQLLGTIADQVAVAIERARIFEAERLARERTEALREAAQVISSSLELTEVLRLLLQQLKRVLTYDTASVLLLEEADQPALVAGIGYADEKSTSQAAGDMLKTSPILRQMSEDLQPVTIADVRAHPGWIWVPGAEHVRSFLAVPIIARQGMIGTLMADSRETHFFGDADVRTAQTLAQHIAIAVQNARLFDETRRHADQLAHVNRISTAINQAFALNDVLASTLRELTHVLHVDRSGIAILADSRDHLTVIAEHNPSGGPSAIGEKIPVPGNPSMEFILRERRAVAVADVEHDQRLGGAAEILRAVGARSILIVPLIGRGEVIGTIGLDSKRSERTFTSAEIEFAQTIANQAAAAIEKARLFEETQRRALVQSTISEIARALNATLDVRQVFPAVAQWLHALVDCDRVSLALLDEPKKDYFSVFALDENDSVLTTGTRMPAAASAAAEDILACRVHLTADLGAEVEYPAERLLYEAGYRSRVNLPLLVGERSIGSLNIVSRRLGAYNIAQLAPLQQIADALAIAIENSRLFQAEQTRRAELAALNRIATAVNQSLALDAILNAALEELTHALNVRGGWVALLDPEKGELVLHAERGGTPEIIASVNRLRFDTGLSGQVAREGQPRAINLEESDVVPRDPLIAAGYRSAAATPLFSTGNVVGVLGLAGDVRDRFGEAELRFLGAAANTLSIALNNARLFASVEKQVGQLATLREIDRTLSSMLDLAPMLETMLSSIAEIVPYDSAAVLLLEGNILRSVAARGREPAALTQFALDISNNTIFQDMARTQTPVIIDDLRERSDWVAIPGAEFARAWLAAPLVARGAMIGQIGLFSATPDAFTREHSDLLRAFANHAAIAIANARLRAELHEQARRDSLTQVLNHGTFIAELRAAGNHAVMQGESLALIMLDLDNFKKYNDTYGHVVGDQVLTVTVEAIRTHIKQSDFVGRWGGEEFAIALRGANIERAKRVASRIRATLRTTPVLDRHGQRIPPPTASQGIAALPEAAHNVDDLIEKADRALYRAKKRGKDQVAVA